MTPSASPGRTLAVLRPCILQGFKWHAAAFLALNGILTVANIATGAPWWAFWPLAGTSALFGLHYILAKSLAADERWAAQRVEELNLKSYDRGHIENLKSRYREGGPDDERR
jgi:hypothetical protein